ncbi:MAG: rhomboid family intramembrane serine protease [Actinobacteria bacterium]|jgi:membrane associated rhomboid family serine protease|nr:rhomboid family intramembrane serine protease [Actinomycetota bacterium]
MTNKNCYWHPDRYAGVTCQRCERRVCAECMHTASVGFHCPACIAPQSINHGRKRISARSFARGANASEQSLTTRTLIAVNLFAFLVTLFRGGSLSSGGGDVTIDFGLVGYGRVLSAFSIDYVGIAEGEWWRMFTGGFLHAGFIHLAFNMFLLWMLGSQLERLLGPTSYLILYFGSLLSGALGVMLLDPLALTVGASGAVFGLMGATVVYQLRRGVSPWSNGIGTLLIINLIFTFARPNISVGGHLGGLLGGLLIGWLIDEMNKKRIAGYLSFLLPLIITVALGFSCLWASKYWYDPILG